METQSKIRVLVLLSGAVLFNWFFWNEGLGLNVLLFTAFILLSLSYLNPHLLKTFVGRIVALSLLASAVQTSLYGSDFSLWMIFIGLLFLPALALSNQINSLVFAVPASLSNFLKLPATLINELKQLETQNVKLGKIWKWVKLVFIPLVFLMIFFFIFRSANDAFAQLTDQIFNEIERFKKWILSCISFERIVFFFLGMGFVAGFLYRAKMLWAENGDKNSKDQIARQKGKSALIYYGAPASNKKNLSLGLKNEYRSAVMMIAMINALLFIINALDINYVWINFKYTPNVNLTKFVHEGTYLLIFSILLSIAIQLYFFRANLNFYSKAKLLQVLNYCWIFQNIVLSVSVAVRNSHYISHFGLAYKRIGVMFFLVLVIFGLLTVFLKIRNRKSAYYLIRVNILAAYIFLVAVNFIDWDMLICNYNLKHSKQAQMDIDFIMHLSDKTLPMIINKKTIIQDSEAKVYYIDKYVDFETALRYRLNEFRCKKSKQTWLSWNWLEAKALAEVGAK